jgi:dTMP kinase
MKKHKSGIFITFEGIDGCGKSTQARMLARALRRLGHAVVLTREPGGTALGRKLRQILLHTTSSVAPHAELFLYLADRIQHIDEVIAPALAAGKVVISERYADSTLAYQGAGRGLPQQELQELNRAATGGLQPDLTILLDISPAQARRRMEASGASPDRFERLEDAFHQRLAREYRRLAQSEPERIKVIKAASDIAQTHARVMQIIQERFYH